jgi:hypothetical protein
MTWGLSIGGALLGLLLSIGERGTLGLVAGALLGWLLASVIRLRRRVDELEDVERRRPTARQPTPQAPPGVMPAAAVARATRVEDPAPIEPSPQARPAKPNLQVGFPQSRRYADPEMRELLKHTGPVGHATLGPREILGGVARLEASRSPEWRRWLLWLGLVVGVGLVAGMALRLLRHPPAAT